MGLFNWLFRKMCNRVFKSVDRNGNGKIEDIEVELAILQLYNIINKRLPGWKDPPSRAQIQAAFKAYDTDCSGALDPEEFIEFARSMLNTGPDMFFARVGRDALVRGAVIPASSVLVRSALASNPVTAGAANTPLAVLAPILGSVFAGIRALLPFGL